MEFCITFTFMHLAGACIQSELQCIQVIHFLSVCGLYNTREIGGQCINVHYCQADLIIIFTNAIHFCVQYALDQGQPTLFLEGYFPVNLPVIFK